MSDLNMAQRFARYRKVWRNRGAAYLDHKLWLFRAIFGRYPR